MDKFLRFTIYFIACLQIVAAVIVFIEGYSKIDMLVAFAILILPILVIFYLLKGPDREERELKKEVNKARLRKELDELKKYIKK